MALRNCYDQIDKYIVRAELAGPLHVGSASGDPEEILIHAADGKPFVQATGIAGVLRAAYRQHYGDEDTLFGGSRGSDYLESRIKISDGVFTDNNDLKLELRPHLKINPETGTVGIGGTKGSSSESGYKFNMEYISAGAELCFDITFFGVAGNDKDFHTRISGILGSANNWSLQFGGKKSNGCGYLNIKQVYYRKFDMFNEKDRKDWIAETQPMDPENAGSGYKKLTDKDMSAEMIENRAFEIIVSGQTENGMLVRGTGIPDYKSEESPDQMNIRNGKGEFILPGSSLKGTLRSRMTQIADYISRANGINVSDVVDNTFGSMEPGENSITGNLRVTDTVIGDIKKNLDQRTQYHVHLDKFTGGVMNGSLFSKKVSAGKMVMKLAVLNRHEPERTMGLLVFALRDLAAGEINLGSGYATGLGFMKIDTIEIRELDADQKALINIAENRIEDEDGLITRCIQSLSKGEDIQ